MAWKLSVIDESKSYRDQKWKILEDWPAVERYVERNVSKGEHPFNYYSMAHVVNEITMAVAWFPAEWWGQNPRTIRVERMREGAFIPPENLVH